MTTSNHYSFREKLLIIISLIITFFVSGITFAQVESIKELKKDVQALNEKGISVKLADPWTIDHIINTEELSKELSNVKTKKTIIYHVGFDFLYKQGHIPGSIYAGPASKQQGLEKIKEEIKNIKHDQDIVLYCGCCPWKDCPNIRQAYRTFKDIGYTNVKVLYIPDTFVKDWKSKGYAMEGRDLDSTAVKK
jgi:rhodanese-related sulfurtransferase